MSLTDFYLTKVDTKIWINKVQDMTCLHRLQFLTLVWKLLLDKFALDYVFADLLGGQRLSAADHAVKTQLIWQQIRTYGQFNPVNCGKCSLLFSCVNVDSASQYYFLCCIRENSKDMHALVLWGLQTDRSVHIKRNFFFFMFAPLQRRWGAVMITIICFFMFLFTSTIPSPVIPPLVSLACLQSAALPF